MEPFVTAPDTVTWWPSCPFSASWLSTASTFESPSVTMTIFSPAAAHFLVQASAPALAPLAPHLASTIQPLTVVLLPMSSNAIADRANTKLNARQISRTFLMAGFSPFGIQIADPRPQSSTCDENRAVPSGHSQSPLGCEMRQRKYTTESGGDCQLRRDRILRGCRSRKLAR